MNRNPNNLSQYLHQMHLNQVRHAENLRIKTNIRQMINQNSQFKSQTGMNSEQPGNVYQGNSDSFVSNDGKQDQLPNVKSINSNDLKQMAPQIDPRFIQNQQNTQPSNVAVVYEQSSESFISN